MSSYQTPDTKKEEFRKYLEKSGVIDALTKGRHQTAPTSKQLPHPKWTMMLITTLVLVGLYEEQEKPENPLE